MPEARLAGTGHVLATRAARRRPRRRGAPSRPRCAGGSARRPRTSLIGVASALGAGGDGRERLLVTGLPTIAASAAGERTIVGATAVSAMRQSSTSPSPLSVTDGGGADDGDLHRAPVLEPQVGAARARRQGRDPHRDEQLAGARRTSGRARSRGRRARRVREPPVERSSTSASSTSSGAPVSIAGEAFMTLPPIVPTWRVAGEPTSALPSARPDQPRRRCRRSTSISAWLTSAPRTRSRRRPDRCRARRDAVDRDDALGQGRLALPGGDDEVGAAGDRAGARRRRPRAPRRAYGRLRSSRAAPPACAPRRARASSAAARSGAPVSFASAFAIAAAVATFGASATPLEPRGPPSAGVGLHPLDGDRRGVGDRLELVVEQRRVAAGGRRRRTSCPPRAPGPCPS